MSVTAWSLAQLKMPPSPLTLDRMYDLAVRDFGAYTPQQRSMMVRALTLYQPADPEPPALEFLKRTVHSLRTDLPKFKLSARPALLRLARCAGVLAVHSCHPQSHLTMAVGQALLVIWLCLQCTPLWWLSPWRHTMVPEHLHSQVVRAPSLPPPLAGRCAPHTHSWSTLPDKLEWLAGDQLGLPCLLHPAL